MLEKIKTLFILIPVLISSAYASQSLSCKEIHSFYNDDGHLEFGNLVQDGMTLKVVIENEKAPVNRLKAKLNLKKYWKEISKLGRASSWDSSRLNKRYWKQHGNKATFVIFFNDDEFSEITYHIYINDELKAEKKTNQGIVELWIDPGLMEGGGDSVHFSCKSKLN